MISKFHSLLSTIGKFLQAPLLLVIRLYWGWQFIQTGTAKLRHLDKSTAFFQSLNIPMPKLNVILAASTESVGGLLLILGLYSRFASLALIGVMCVAYATADSEALHAIFSNPDKFLSADPFLFLFASVLVFAFGPGKISIDALVRKDPQA
jgi:putative oxidoreductase